MIEINNLNVSFKETKVLKNVNIKIESGAVTAIVGRNGSRKTVLLKCMAGFLRPGTGNVLIDGHDIYNDGQKIFNIGVLIETPEFMDYLSGFENLKSLATIRNIASDNDIMNLMKFFELPIDKKFVKKYSLGMRQKLGIIQAVMENQDIILLDEPTNSLDVRMVDKFKQLIIDLKKKGKTIVIISHIEEDIMPLADAIYTIANGDVIKSEKSVV